MSTNLQFHNATQDTFDAMPGEITAYDADDRGVAFRTKITTLRAIDGNLLRLTLYCNTPAPEPSPEPEPEANTPLTPSLKAAIQKRLDERAAERRDAEIEKAKKDAERRDREQRAREFFISELEAREGVTLQASQVEVEEEKTRAVYNISVSLSKTIIIWFRGGMYYNTKMEFAFSSWVAGTGNWLFIDDCYPTLADAVIAALDINDTALTGADDLPNFDD